MDVEHLAGNVQTASGSARARNPGARRRAARERPVQGWRGHNQKLDGKSESEGVLTHTLPPRRPSPRIFRTFNAIRPPRPDFPIEPHQWALSGIVPLFPRQRRHSYSLTSDDRSLRFRTRSLRSPATPYGRPRAFSPTSTRPPAHVHPFTSTTPPPPIPAHPPTHSPITAFRFPSLEPLHEIWIEHADEREAGFDCSSVPQPTAGFSFEIPCSYRSPVSPSFHPPRTPRPLPSPTSTQLSTTHNRAYIHHQQGGNHSSIKSSMPEMTNEDGRWVWGVEDRRNVTVGTVGEILVSPATFLPLPHGPTPVHSPPLSLLIEAFSAVAPAHLWGLH